MQTVENSQYIYGYTDVWVYGYMGIWIYECMCIMVYIDTWVHGCMAISWLYGYIMAVWLYAWLNGHMAGYVSVAIWVYGYKAMGDWGGGVEAESSRPGAMWLYGCTS